MKMTMFQDNNKDEMAQVKNGDGDGTGSYWG